MPPVPVHHPVLLSRTSFLRLGAGLLAAPLAACVNQPGANRQPSTDGAAVAGPVNTGRKVGILLPLTGPNAELGQGLLKAAQLALSRRGSPVADVQDTLGTPAGAAAAASKALEDGCGILIGPLTAGETSAATSAATGAGAPMLAFTSDVTVARSGVWTLGITPAQQVRRLVQAIQAEGKSRIAAVLPQNPFGDALAAGLAAAAQEANLPPPRIVRTPGTFAGFNDALRTVSDDASRRPASQTSRTIRTQADLNGAEPVPADAPPPPMDALLLGATGDLLRQVAPLLAYYGISPARLRVLGPATWLREAARLPDLAGSWFASPDGAARKEFDTQYTAKYGAAPRDFASLAYDAAGIARATLGPAGFTVASLTRPEGFSGADGLIGLLTDGKVRRGLAVFQVDRGGSHIVQPAPTSLAAGNA